MTTTSFGLVVNTVVNPIIEGDLDEDGDVDYGEYMTFMNTLSTSEGDEGYIAEANYDGDSSITYADYNIAR